MDALEDMNSIGQRISILSVLGDESDFDFSNEDPLSTAVADGDIEGVTSLLGNGILDTVKGAELRMNCAMLAVQTGHLVILQLLKETVVQGEALSASEVTKLLHAAVQARQLDCLEVLIKAGDINGENEAGKTPLYVAVEECWVEGVYSLLHEKADIEREYVGTSGGVLDSEKRPGKTILQVAGGRQATSDQRSIFRYIVQAARSYDHYREIINVTGKHQRTPLMTAVLSKNLEFVDILLKSGVADVTRLDESSCNVLHLAVVAGQAAILEVLLAHYPDNNAILAGQRCSLGRFSGTPLLLAVYLGECQCAKLLVAKAGASISAEATIGKPPDDTDSSNSSQTSTTACISSSEQGTYNVLHLAAMRKNPDTIKYFCDRLAKDDELRALVSRRTDNDATPLHLALMRRQVEFVRALISAGSDLTAMYRDERTKASYSALDMLLYQVPASVDVLTDVLDRAIDKVRKQAVVRVDYTVLMPVRSCQRSTVHNGDVSVDIQKNEVRFVGQAWSYMQPQHSLAVLDELQRSGNNLGQRKLLEHPLVTSYLHLHWKKLEIPYLILVALSVGYALALSVAVYCEQILELRDARCVLATVVWGLMAVLLAQELQIAATPRPASYWFESLVKCICFVLTVWLVLPDAPAECSAFAVLLAWFQVLLLVSRVPHHGHYMFMFIEIATKYLKLLLAFLFIVLAFALAFMVSFRMRSPFDTTLAALMKTIVMMSNEYEYEDILGKINAGGGGNVTRATMSNGTGKHAAALSAFSQFSAMTVLVIFIVVIGLVLTNLFVGVAVNDISVMHMINKRIEFIAVYEQFLLAPPHGVVKYLARVLCFVIRICTNTKDTKYTNEVQRFHYINVCNREEDDDTSTSVSSSLIDSGERLSTDFPEELNCALVVKGYENRERINEKYRGMDRARDEGLALKKAEELKETEERAMADRREEVKRMAVDLGKVKQDVAELLRLIRGGGVVEGE